VKTKHTITMSALDLIGLLKEKLDIQAHVADINLSATSTGVQVDLSEIRLEWVIDTSPRDIWNR
jgi:hypothetical protein